MKRYCQALIATILAGFALAYMLAWLLGPIQGDLVRIGGWPERDFAPSTSSTQEMMAPNHFAEAPPQIIIAGDSFSLPGYWQARYASNFDYQTIDIEGLCLEEYLDSPAFRQHPPAILILQSVERFFVRRFTTESCTNHTALPVGAHDLRADSAHSRAKQEIRAGFVLTAVPAMLREIFARGPLVISGESVEQRLARSDLFSNRRSNRLLFYSGDLDKRHWQDAQVDFAVRHIEMLAKRAEANGKTIVVFALVPDKSQVYAPYLEPGPPTPDFDIGPRLSAAGVRAPDLKKIFREAVANGTVDLFLPDDTHLGRAGYQLLADSLAAITLETPEVAAHLVLQDGHVQTGDKPPSPQLLRNKP